MNLYEINKHNYFYWVTLRRLSLGKSYVHPEFEILKPKPYEWQNPVILIDRINKSIQLRKTYLESKLIGGTLVDYTFEYDIESNSYAGKDGPGYKMQHIDLKLNPHLYSLGFCKLIGT